MPGRWDNAEPEVSLPKKDFQKMLLACGIAGSLISLGVIWLATGFSMLFHC